MDEDDIDPGRLLRTTEERPIGVTVPVPISKRLDRLVDLAESAGVRVFRKDIVAALVLAAPEEPEKLVTLCINYRTAKAADAGIGEEPDATVLTLHRSKPGRRPRK